MTRASSTIPHAPEPAPREPSDEDVAAQLTADYWPWARADVVAHVRAATERARKAET